MAITHERWGAGTLLASLWLGFPLPAGAQSQPQRLPMRVVIYNDAGVASPVLEGAQRVVSSVFGGIGVDAVWMDPAGLTREMPNHPAQRRAFVASFIQVKLVSAAMFKGLGLKENAMGAANSGTCCAWISIAKVQQSADLARMDLGDALGYVMAHEIGHLLLPANSHSVNGLMQAHIDPELVSHDRLAFHPREVALIRATLADRVMPAFR